MYRFKNVKAAYASLKATEKMVAKIIGSEKNTSCELWENQRDQFLIVVKGYGKIISVRRYDEKPEYWENVKKEHKIS